MSDFTKNVILNVQDKGTDNARRSIQKLNSETAKLLLGMEDIASESKKAMETIGLGADAQVSRLQRLSNAFQGFTGKIGAGIGAIDNFAKSLAPWNQALELGGKAIRFLDSGLDAAAKKYPEHAKDIEALRKQFGGLKEDVMAAVGVMTVELLRPIRPLEEMERRVDALRKKLRGEGPQGSSGFRGDNEAGDFWGAAAGRGTFDESTGVDFFARMNGQIETYTKRTEASAAATKKAAEETARLNKELRDQAMARAFLRTASTSEGRNVTDTAGSPVGWSTKGLGEKADSIARDMYGRDAERQALDDINSQVLKLEKLRSNSEFAKRSLGVGMRDGEEQGDFLARQFGSLDQFSAYATAFNTLTTATQSAMQAWISGSESLGAAIKKGLGVALAGLASSMAVESLKHGAYALGSLAFGDIRGASTHGAAAAAFGAGAAAAAVAAKQLGGGGSTPSGGGGRDQRGGGGESGDSGRANGGTINSNRTREAGGVERIYIIDDEFSDLTPRQRALAIEKKMRNQGRRVHSEDE